MQVHLKSTWNPQGNLAGEREKKSIAQKPMKNATARRLRRAFALIDKVF